jgi:CubicO group peptidase (beta-lactamase class C family)
MWRKLVCLSALALPLLGAVSAETPDSAVARSLSARIEAYLAPFLADGHLSGTLLVARNGEILFERAYGMANYELSVPNTPQTRHCIASITKPMTIAVVSQLAKDEVLHPDDPVAKWIEGFPRGDRITISDLLNHRAGIPHRVTTDVEEAQPHSAAEMVQLIKKSDFIFEPGEKSVYSSAGYSVLARIIELATGKPYGQVLQERIFQPTGMTRSLHPEPPHLIPDRASSYIPAPHGVLNAPLKDMSFLVGAGSVFSTPRDIHAMIRGLLEDRLGETAKAALLRDNGLRWNGITNGYRAFADYHSDTGVEVIFTGNLHSGAADRVRRDLPKIVAGEEIPTPERLDVEAVEVDEPVLLGYEGIYESDRGQKFTLRLQSGALFAGNRLLVPTSKTTFYSLQDYGRVNVIFDDDGNVERLDWEWGDQFWPWRRIGEIDD